MGPGKPSSVGTETIGRQFRPPSSLLKARPSVPRCEPVPAKMLPPRLVKVSTCFPLRPALDQAAPSGLASTPPLYPAKRVFPATVSELTPMFSRGPAADSHGGPHGSWSGLSGLQTRRYVTRSSKSGIAVESECLLQRLGYSSRAGRNPADHGEAHLWKPSVCRSAGVLVCQREHDDRQRSGAPTGG